MDKVMITIATLALASSLSFFEPGDASIADEYRQVPPPAPPAEATIDDERGDANGRVGCLACGGLDGERK